MAFQPPHLTKQAFFENNNDFEELEIDKTSIGNFHDISDSHDFWLLQCPKNTDLTHLEGQKMKLPGRSSCNGLETVAVEGREENVQAFGYVNRKRTTCLRLLPIKGTIVVRSQLKGNQSVNMEDILTLFPPPERVPMPNGISVRHPLLGSEYSKKITVKTEIMQKLKSADDNNLRIMHESGIICKNDGKAKIKEECTSKGSSKKRKQNEIDFDTTVSPKKMRELLSPKKEMVDDISDDLQWLHEL